MYQPMISSSYPIMPLIPYILPPIPSLLLQNFHSQLCYKLGSPRKSTWPIPSGVVRLLYIMLKQQESTQSTGRLRGITQSDLEKKKELKDTRFVWFVSKSPEWFPVSVKYSY